MIQTAGRAARHLNGEVILYADVMTQSIQKFLAVSEYRREKQMAYNKEHNITPRSVSRRGGGKSFVAPGERGPGRSLLHEAGVDFDVTETIRELEEEMLAAANNLEFEKAALLRDQIRELKRATGDGKAGSSPPRSVMEKESAAAGEKPKADEMTHSIQGNIFRHVREQAVFQTLLAQNLLPEFFGFGVENQVPAMRDE